jgi:putative acetyltransferase
MSPLVIRDEEPRDVASITAITRAAFADHPHSNDTEYLIVAALRRFGALTISLVAEEAGRVVGHVAFSPVTISDGSPHWYGLGPVSVVPDKQRRGIGTALIEQGLARLRELDAAGCVVLGEPEYYTRFGFAHDPQLTYAGVPPEYFLALPLSSVRAAGEVRYHAAFQASE